MKLYTYYRYLMRPRRRPVPPAARPRQSPIFDNDWRNRQW